MILRALSLRAQGERQDLLHRASALQGLTLYQNIPSMSFSFKKPLSPVHIFAQVCFNSISGPKFLLRPKTFPDCENRRSTSVEEAGILRMSRVTRARGFNR